MEICIYLPQTPNWRRSIGHAKERLDGGMNVYHDAPERAVLGAHHPRTVLVHEQGGAGARTVHEPRHHDNHRRARPRRRRRTRPPHTGRHAHLVTSRPGPPGVYCRPPRVPPSSLQPGRLGAPSSRHSL